MARLHGRRLHRRLFDHRPTILSESVRRHCRYTTTCQTPEQSENQQATAGRRQQERLGTRPGSRQRRSVPLKTSEIRKHTTGLQAGMLRRLRVGFQCTITVMECLEKLRLHKIFVKVSEPRWG